MSSKKKSHVITNLLKSSELRFIFFTVITISERFESFLQVLNVSRHCPALHGSSRIRHTLDLLNCLIRGFGMKEPDVQNPQTCFNTVQS